MHSGLDTHSGTRVQLCSGLIQHLDVQADSHGIVRVSSLVLQGTPKLPEAKKGDIHKTRPVYTAEADHASLVFFLIQLIYWFTYTCSCLLRKLLQQVQN